MNKPVVFATVSLAVGCISSFLFFNNIYIGAAFAASFLAIIFFTNDFRFSIILFLFFFTGFLSFFAYFNISIPSKGYYDIRVVKKSSFYTLAEINGRRVMLTGDINKLDAGDQGKVKGSFTKDVSYSEGVIGILQVDRFSLNSNNIITKLSRFKSNSCKAFSKNLDKEDAAMVSAICFGDSSFLDDDNKNDIKELGLVHAVTVSGFHMAIIYKILERIFGVYGSLILSFVYILITGSSVSAVRSFIMILTLKLSKKFSRKNDSLSSLALSAGLILLAKPYSFMDVGFVLSYLSVIGIIIYYKRLKKIFLILPAKLNENISISLSSQIFSLPYAALTIKYISLFFIPANIILLPLFTCIIVLANISALFSGVKPIFDFLCFLIKIILTSISGGINLLLKYSPSLQYISYGIVCAVMILYVLGIFYKHGFKRLIFLPPALLIALALEYYAVFPEIIYVNNGANDNVIIRAGNKSVLIASDLSQKKIDDLKEFYGIKQVISAKDAPYDLSSKELDAQITKPMNSRLNVLLSMEDCRVCFSRELKTIDNEKLSSQVLVPNENITSKTEFNKESIICYNIICGKVVRIY